MKLKGVKSIRDTPWTNGKNIGLGVMRPAFLSSSASALTCELLPGPLMGQFLHLKLDNKLDLASLF